MFHFLVLKHMRVFVGGSLKLLFCFLLEMNWLYGVRCSSTFDWVRVQVICLDSRNAVDWSFGYIFLKEPE